MDVPNESILTALMMRFYPPVLTGVLLLSILLLSSCKSEERHYAEDCLISSLQAIEDGSDLDAERLSYGCNFFFKKGDRRMRALAYYVRGKAGEREEDDPSARWIDDLARGCNEAEHIRDHSLAARLYIAYGIAMVEHDWFKSAIPILSHGRAEAAKADMKPEVIMALMNLSRCYLRIDDGDGVDYRTAIDYSVGASEVAHEAGLWNEYSKALFALSSCYHRAGMDKEALEAATRSARLMEEQYAAGIRKEPVRYSALARAYYHLGQADSAIYFSRIDLQNPHLTTQAEANHILYKVYRNILADSLTASRYLENYHAIRDSMDRATPDERISEYIISLREEIAQKGRTNLIVVLAIILASSALLITVIVIAYRRRIAQKERDLIKDKALLEENEQTLEGLRLAVADNEELLAKLKKNPRYLSDAEWDRLERIIDKMYEGYLDSAREKGLTDNNLRLLSAVKLGFGTSECATMLGISPSSVTKAKQRLKAKGIS